MADQSDVRRIALALPGTSQADDRFAFSVRNGGKDKGFAWTWNERVEPKKPRVPRPDVLVVRVASRPEKEMLLASDQAKFFTEPHYNGFPAVLVRLPAIEAAELAELITEAWRCQAPRALADSFEPGRQFPPVRYRSSEEDSARWDGFPFRDGDIVISTRSKSGTTWMQMICALLVFQTADLPAPLGQLSPWLDWLTAPRDQVYALLAAQDHRRFIKTHTPLDGIPLDSRATYIVVARHPLDMAVSLYHQGDNIDRVKLRQLTGQPEPGRPRPPRLPLRDWLLRWIDADADPREEADSLPGVMWHLADAWNRRGEPNVLLVRYDDLSADLGGEMRGLARALGIRVPGDAWPSLVRAAGFESMRAAAAADDQRLGPAGVMKSRAAFFRRGTPGAGRELLADDELARYQARAAQLAPPDLLSWLHGAGSGRAPP